MGTRELLRYLEKLEIGLSSFSYEELGTVEAGKLKKSFEVFKNGLEAKVFGISEMEQLEVIYEQVGIQGSKRERPFDTLGNSFEPDPYAQLLSLINSLENTPLSIKQREIAQRLRVIVVELTDSEKNIKEELKMAANTRSLTKKWESNIYDHEINLKSVLEECMGQMELLDELIKIYKQNVLEFIGSLKVNIHSQNFKEIRVACQKVQPCLRMMKTVGLLEIIQQMDTACKTDNDIVYLKFLYNQFLNEYPKVEELVDFEIKALRNM